MQEQYAGRVSIIGVAGYADLDDMKQFIRDTATDGFPHIVDVDGAIWESFGVGTQPSWAFINDDGTWTKELNALGEAGLTERAEELLSR